MKKLFMLGLITSSTLLLTACGNKEENSLENIQNPNINQETILPNNEITMTSKEAIKEYLENADFQWMGEEIKVGDYITVDYIWRLDSENVFDTSIESIAKASGKYTDGRDYNEGLPFTAGAGQMIPWFDNAVIWMKIWQTKTIEIPSTEAYGERNEENVMRFPLSDIPNPENFMVGQQIWLDQGISARIIDKSDKEIILDMNHELAGKNLIFDITIKSIN